MKLSDSSKPIYLHTIEDQLREAAKELYNIERIARERRTMLLKAAWCICNAKSTDEDILARLDYAEKRRAEKEEEKYQKRAKQLREAVERLGNKVGKEVTE